MREAQPPEHDRWLWRAFEYLGDMRPRSGDGPPHPISMEAIEAYARFHRIPPPLRDDFLYFVNVLDRKWRAHVLELQRIEAAKRPRH